MVHAIDQPRYQESTATCEHETTALPVEHLNRRIAQARLNGQWMNSLATRLIKYFIFQIAPYM
jgi:hypothetical protein